MAPALLIRGVGDGMTTQRQQFEQLYRAHRRALRGLARRLTRTEDDADDLLQATFERALLKFATFRPGTNARSWLARIMTRLFIDQCRRRPLTPVPVAELEVPAPQPEEEPWWAALTEQDVRLAVAELSPELRLLVEAQVYDGQTYATLADRTGLLAATVGSRLYRSRRRLREVLLRHHGALADAPTSNLKRAA
jgi:RNA polymerase sigma-70 factor, ECF subfamily